MITSSHLYPEEVTTSITNSESDLQTCRTLSTPGEKETTLRRVKGMSCDTPGFKPFPHPNSQAREEEGRGGWEDMNILTHRALQGQVSIALRFENQWGFMSARARGTVGAESLLTKDQCLSQPFGDPTQKE